ncbi:hypothetical protein HMPREF1981_01998 [Bacteroides pyogenes F0041]|uniref:Uncharacterized protein n=1 Tax=Bacteroides pyogenes F0041 TaxID=1321819 RepID=U2DYX6_9BACE|nr:hypothetical protein [Bacteroides pyogenes]ERI85111.1 hypothetical protein HMPREF1981_01998 [Bacteroides pyogenes F0041]
MANIDGGALSFKSVMENDQMNSAIEETLRRVQGLSDATVAGGKQMDKAFMQTTDGIRDALGKIGQACEIHETKLGELTGQYVQLGQEASAAFMAGRDEEYRAIEETRAGIQGEIAVRKQALEEARNLSNELEKEAAKREEATRQVEENAKAHQSLRFRIKELKEEMAMLIDQGIDEQSEAYKALVNELGRLQDIQGDIAQQGKILANDEAKFQGFIQGLSGLSGAFSAATGAISLFAGENENLQKVMTKVQSVMAIAMGMQSVAQTLNKDSAFQLVTLNGLKEWWAGIVAKATVAETAETAATVANTTAQQAQATATAQSTVVQGANTVATGAQAAAATAGTVANFTLAGAFRAVGLAIKSIPVFGWVLAGISALIALVSHFSSKAREAKKAQEEFSKAMIEGCYKPIGKVEELSVKYTALGDNIKEKEQFIKDNKKAFDELGVSVTNVRDAENLLINNKEAFISAQIAKAKALVYSQQAAEKVKKQMELQAEYESMSDTRSQWVQTSSFGTGYYIQVENTAKKEKKKEIDDLNAEIRDGYKKATEEETAALKEMKQSGINAVKTYAKGTVGAIEQAISEKQEALKDLVPNSAEWNKANKEIEALQKQLEKPTKKTTSKSDKDPFVEQLEKRKAEYERFKKWVNSGDEVLVKSAASEFSGLLAQGATYIDYLKKQRDIILSVDVENRSKEQINRLRTLNDQIAEETKKTVLEAFNEELATQLGNAKTALDILNIIAQKRKELAEDGTDVDNDKKQALDDAEKNALQKQEEETKKLLDDYASYLDKKIKLDLEYSNDLALLEKARAKATTDEERRKIDAAISNRKKQYDKDSKLSGDSEYDQMLQTYRTFEQKKEDIIEEFSEKRKKAQEHGNTEMLAQLDKAQNEALSKLAIDEMKISPDWEKMFGNLDEIGTRELERLLATIEGKTAVLGIELSPEDFKVIQDKVKELKNEIKERNPFKALTKGFEDLKKATSDQDKTAALAGMFDSAGKAGNQLKGIISDVTNTLESLGVEGTEEVGHAIQALDGFASGAQDAVMGFMSGNPVQMVGGAIKAIGSVVNYFAGANDRRAERAIKKHQENVKNLTSAYKELEWQISKALSGNLYKHQQASIENMKQQQRELQGMIRAEQDKKKTDNDKIREWREQIKELNRSIEDTIDGMKKSLLDTDVKAIATQLGDAIISAFENGKDAATAWGDTVKNIVNNLVKNMLIQKVLQEPIDKVISKYTSKWVDKNGVFKGFDVVIGDIDSLSSELGGLYPSLERSINALKEKLNLSTLENDSSLTGAVKGVTEETASIVAGQLNAMRINQVEASAILRQQLAMLSVIAQNTSYNRFLVEIHKELKAMNAGSDPLRSQGLV